MSRFENRRVKHLGRPVYGRGNSAPAKRRKRQFRMPSGWFLPLVSFGLMILLIIVVNQFTTLDKVSIQGATASSSAQIEKAAKDGLSRQWFGSSLIFVNADSLRSYILKNEPITEEIKIKRSFPHTLVVVVTERQSGILWKSGEQLYLLDRRGTVVGGGGVAHSALPVVVDSTNLPVKPGDRVVPQSFVAFVSELNQGLAASKIKITEMSIPQSSSELHVKTDRGIIIKFDTSRPAAAALEDLKQIQGHLSKTKKSPAEYIDLRINGKAYYK